ncbi:MAG: hypothetical protein V3U66_00030 [Acidobacteriota bacterium]
MKHRDETVEMAVLPGNRRNEDLRRTVQYIEGPRTEDARRDGRIRGSSRGFMNYPG